uniref:Uncharacterized protein n=1 Tax=Arundo donax TaxID=35708 RepID=A0A0A9CRB4_ARUDO
MLFSFQYILSISALYIYRSISTDYVEHCAEPSLFGQMQGKIVCVAYFLSKACVKLI